MTPYIILKKAASKLHGLDEQYIFKIYLPISIRTKYGQICYVGYLQYKMKQYKKRNLVATKKKL